MAGFALTPEVYLQIVKAHHSDSVSRCWGCVRGTSSGGNARFAAEGDLRRSTAAFLSVAEIAQQKKVSLAWVVREASEKYVVNLSGGK
jgi:hypothetical protein